jgi:hypothetical protein
MTSYPFIEALFKNILLQSRAVEGRFFVSTRNAMEINSDTFAQVLTDELAQLTVKKYPVALMMPPRSRGAVKFLNDEYQAYSITLLFLKTTYYDAGGVTNPNPNTGTSTHTILQDWHDMKRAAEGFLRVLDKLTRANANLFRLSGEDKFFTPVSTVGVDRVSGVRVDFTLSLFSGCELEDYDPADISSITIPDADTHPEHNL